MATNLNPTALTGLSGVARRLVVDAALSEADARKAVEASSRQKIPFGSYLVQNALASAAAVGTAASHEFGIPLFDVRALDLKQAPVKLVEEKLIQQHKIQAGIK